MKDMPSPRELLELLSRDLSFDSVRKAFPQISDQYLRETLKECAGNASARMKRAEAGAPAPATRKGEWKAHIDGGSRGNPGPAAAGAYVNTPNGALEIKKCLGHATNNVAEYSALIMLLEAALDDGVTQIEVRADSELLVKQMKGIYKVKNHNLAPLFIKAKNLEKKFKSFTIIYVPREENLEADRLVNEALDEAAADERKEIY
jgi:ribonuclease HI